MEIAVFIQNIQEERAEVALYIFTNQTNSNLNQSIILSNNRCSNNNNSIMTVCNSTSGTASTTSTTPTGTGWAFRRGSARRTGRWRRCPPGPM